MTRDNKMQRELLYVFTGAIVIFFVTLFFNIFDRILWFLLAYENWQVDEIFILTAYFTLALGIFSYRRWKEVNKELESRKILEKELIRAKDETDLANIRLSKFLTDMSHELRTPLNSVIGFSEMLIDGIVGELNEKQRDCVNNISISGAHLLHLINQLLDLAKIESGKVEMDVEDFSIQEIFDEVHSILMVLARKKKIDLTFHNDPKLDVINADRVKVKQILFNLASNAIKFTPENGIVRIEATKDDDMVTIKVTDSGHGMSKDDIRKIFDPFEQLGALEESGYKGTGLGLTIVNDLVEMHKGRIWVESEPEKGSTFILKLPVNFSVEH